MLSEAIQQKLRDPAYLDLHLAAVASLKKVSRFVWYDSGFLHEFEAAKRFLSEVRPDALSMFVEAFDALRPRRDFKVTMIDGLFDTATHERICEIARARPEQEQVAYETEGFGRYVVQHHPEFDALQREVLPLVSDRVGHELTAGYNFLSLYDKAGKCDMHMDEPVSMYTLDYCIEQSCEWPIYFSETVEWPTLEASRNWSPRDMPQKADLTFEKHLLRPNNALIFNGSSQWHYRDPIPAGGHCSLLFFHYFPVGCQDLVEPCLWYRHFDIPELEPFCELLRLRIPRHGLQ